MFKEDETTVGMIFGDGESDVMINKYMLLIYGRDAEADLSVVVTAIVFVAEDNRRRVAEYFGRANYGLNQYAT